MVLSNCALCGKKISTFTKNQEIHNFNNFSNDQFEMNKIINKFLLAREKFIQ